MSCSSVRFSEILGAGSREAESFFVCYRIKFFGVRVMDGLKRVPARAWFMAATIALSAMARAGLHHQYR